MPVYLLVVAIVLFACVAIDKLSRKLGIPMLLVFILLGMFFGSDGLIKIPFDNFEFAEQICSIALIFIMFYGGFGTSWEEAKPVAAKALLLSSLGVIFTAGITGLFCHLILRFNWIESFLIGSVISSTDAASVFSILRSKRLHLKHNTASLLELESGSNDPVSYMLTATLIMIQTGERSYGSVAYNLAAQIIFGIVFGVMIAITASWLLKRIKFSVAGFDAAFVFAVAILSYAAPASLGGNGYLSAFIVGIVLGNSKIKNKRTLVPFFDGITGLMQILIFFLLGLLAFPSRLPQVALPALCIFLFLTFVARPVSVFTILSPFKSKLTQQLVVSWTGLRGAASIVFGIMATQSVKSDLFHIVFCIVLFSILIQGALLPFVSKKLNMIDEKENVMKTFTDYIEEVPVQFIEFTISATHQWCGSTVKDIVLPPGTILVLLQREGNKIVPNGDTKLLPGDVFVLSAKSPVSIDGIELFEKHIDKGDPLVGKALSEVASKSSSLIIMILRSDQTIIPNGDTILKADDVLVINVSHT